MYKNNIRPYEISLWTLQDSFITVLKPYDLESKGQVETPKIIIKNDGTQELSFKIPMYYRDNGERIENPLWYDALNGVLLINLRKLKVIFNKESKGEEEIFEFVINKITETHSDSQLYCEVTGEGLAFQELGKTGYKLSLLEDNFLLEYEEWDKKTVKPPEPEEGVEYDYETEDAKKADEPIQSLDYWCEQVFKNSNWTYSIQMDWSGFDGIFVENIKIDNYEGTYADAPKEIKDKYNVFRQGKKLRRLDKVYEEEYISSWEEKNGTLTPRELVSFKEKARPVQLEKSNRYNITQSLAETFGIFCKYKYHYDENYHIIKRECIFYNNFLSDKEKIDINYPFDSSSIQREMESTDIVTKMYVTSVEDESSASGLLTIADVDANKTKEDYILNFDYLYKIGTINEEQYKGVSEFERKIYGLNTELIPYSAKLIKLEDDLVGYKADLSVAQEAQIQAKEQMENANSFIQAVTEDGVLEVTLNKPTKKFLNKTEIKEGKQYYNIKITEEGILKEWTIEESNGTKRTIPLKVFYQKPNTNSSTPPNEKYEEIPNFTGEISNFRIVTDDFGNIVQITDLKEIKVLSCTKEEHTHSSSCQNGGNGSSSTCTKEEHTHSDECYSIIKSVFLTYAYQPKLHYQNIYNIYARLLAKNELLEEECLAKIEELEKEIEKIEKEYKIKIEEKNKVIADFERMMGPALKEGSWQPENYTNYGDKYNEKLLIKNGAVAEDEKSKYLSFVWDNKAFDGEQLGYEISSVEETKKSFPCIKLPKQQNILDNLEHLSFIYGSENDRKSLTIESQAFFAFLKEDGVANFYPVILLTKAKDELASLKINPILGMNKTSLGTDGTVSISKEVFYNIVETDWINLNPEKEEIYYPRLKINTLSLKTSTDELSVKYDENVLEKFHDYSVLIRENNYFITLDSYKMVEFYLKDKWSKKIEVSYAISNAATAIYLDSLEVSKTNAFPQVSYTIEVSALNKDFIRKAYSMLNRIVNINDADLKLENVQGYISELELDLDKFWEDKITVQNYKTKFEDLFATIVASSEQMKVNSYAYNTAASAFTSSGGLSPTVMQNSIGSIDLTYAFNNGQLTIDETNGIWARSDAGVVAMRGGGIFCASQKDGVGNWIWNTGITPTGINASLLRAGQIDTNLIKVYAGDNLRFQLNADGLFAYKANNDGSPSMNDYVVQNSDGLFLINKTGGSENRRVEISWNGLILRNGNGEEVFYADNETGNLTITGTISAHTGYIGKWKITEDGLQEENGKAGFITGVPLDDEGNTESGLPYPMLWVVSEQKKSEDEKEERKFEVYSDGTIFANNAIFKGFVQAGTYLGGTSTEELDEELRNIKITIAEGSTFTFDNRNYDGNLITSPINLLFLINKQTLSREELTYKYKIGNDTDGYNETEIEENSYNFYWADAGDNINAPMEELTWVPIDKDDPSILFKPEFLTFYLTSDIMKIGEVEVPRDSLYIKVEKPGKKRVIEASAENPNGKINYINGKGDYVIKDGEIKLEKIGPGEEPNPYLYNAYIQLVSEKIGWGKLASEVSPQSYTFIKDVNDNNKQEYEDSTSFSVVLEGFTMDEDVVKNSTWLVNGEEVNWAAEVKSTYVEQDDIEDDGSALLVSNTDPLYINEEEVTGPDENGTITTSILGEVEKTTEGLTYTLTEQEDGKIIATLNVKSSFIQEGEHVTLTYKIGYATRIAYCFKTRNGADSVSISLTSTSGEQLSYGDTSTEISANITYGTRILNPEETEGQFFYVWKKDGVALSEIQEKKIFTAVDSDEIETEFNFISKIDRYNNSFKKSTIYVEAEDISLKAIYSCDIFTSLEEAKQEYLIQNEWQEEFWHEPGKENSFIITKQPKDVSVKMGEYAITQVEALGAVYYQWYYCNKGVTSFIESPTLFGPDKNTYRIEMNEIRDGRKIYCLITDDRGRQIQSNIVTLNGVKE